MPSSLDTSVGRIYASGVGAAASVDLVSVGFARTASDANESHIETREILRKLGSIGRLRHLSPVELTELFGLEDFEGLRAHCLMELGRRMANAGTGDPETIESPEDVKALLKHLVNEKREHFCIVLLDAKNRVMRTSTVHIGTLTMSVVGPREVFREAIREGASAIIAAHNHPSGDPTPSPEDIDVTAKLVEVGKLLDIPLLDHVIIGTRAVSLRERGLIK